MRFDIYLLGLLNGIAGHSHFLDGIIIFFSSYFQYVVGIALLAAIAYSARNRSEKIRILLAGILSVAIARLGVAELIRLLYHRPRPFLTQPVHQLFTVNEWSFPSGHAVFFFALATTIFGFNKRWGAWLFVAAMLISISRVIAGVHYPSDILGGAIIGCIVGWVVWYRAK